MSRIGKKPIAVPAGVEVKIDGSTVTVKGPKGTLTQSFRPEIGITLEGSEIHVTRPNDEKIERSLHGLTRTLVANMVHGVVEEYKKELEINGIGYRAQKQGKQLILTLGYSHQVIVEDTADVATDVPAPNKIIVHGPDKQKVGQLPPRSARSARPSRTRARGSSMWTK